MGNIRKRPFNFPRGTFGDLIIKERLGKPYVSSKPVRKKVKQTPKLKQSKNLFGFFGKLTPVLHSDPKIRGMWDASDIPGETSRNKIMHINYKLIPVDRDLTNFRLSPLEGLFHAPVIETVWGFNKVTVTFGILEGFSNHRGHNIISAHGVVRYYGFKIKKYENKFLFEKISSVPIVYKKGEQHTFSFEYDSDYTKDYNNRQFCFALIIENSDGIAVECSENIIL